FRLGKGFLKLLSCVTSSTITICHYLGILQGIVVGSKCLNFFPKFRGWLGGHDHFLITQRYSFSILIPALINNRMAHLVTFFLFRSPNEYPISLRIEKLHFFTLWQFSRLL